MSFTTYFYIEKPAYQTLRFDIPLNANFDLIDDGFRDWASGTEPGTAPNYDDITLTEGLRWRDTTNHRSKVYNGSAWEIFLTDSVASGLKNSMSAPTATADMAYIYCADQTAGNAVIKMLTEGNKTLTFYQQSHIADVDATVIASLTNSYGTADGTFEDIGATNSSDVSGAIKNNFKECSTNLVNLKTVVDSLRTKLNSVFTYLENIGFNATS
jgi:hypothetical protein